MVKRKECEPHHNADVIQFIESQPGVFPSLKLFFKFLVNMRESVPDLKFYVESSRFAYFGPVKIKSVKVDIERKLSAEHKRILQTVSETLGVKFVFRVVKRVAYFDEDLRRQLRMLIPLEKFDFEELYKSIKVFEPTKSQPLTSKSPAVTNHPQAVSLLRILYDVKECHVFAEFSPAQKSLAIRKCPERAKEAATLLSAPVALPEEHAIFCKYYFHGTCTSYTHSDMRSSFFTTSVEKALRYGGYQKEKRCIVAQPNPQVKMTIFDFDSIPTDAWLRATGDKYDIFKQARVQLCKLMFSGKFDGVLIAGSELYIFEPSKALVVATDSHAIAALGSWGAGGREKWESVKGDLEASLRDAVKLNAVCTPHTECFWEDIVAKVDCAEQRSFLLLLTKTIDSYMPVEWHPVFLLRSIKEIKNITVQFSNNTSHTF